MSLLGLLSLICALATGVSITESAPWTQGAFLCFLFLALTSFAASTLRRPSLLWEVIDDLNGKRSRQLNRMLSHPGKGEAK